MKQPFLQFSIVDCAAQAESYPVSLMDETELNAVLKLNRILM